MLISRTEIVRDLAVGDVQRRKGLATVSSRMKWHKIEIGKPRIMGRPAGRYLFWAWLKVGNRTDGVSGRAIGTVKGTKKGRPAGEIKVAKSPCGKMHPESLSFGIELSVSSSISKSAQVKNHVDTMTLVR